jgi:hypothetical protein
MTDCAAPSADSAIVQWWSPGLVDQQRGPQARRCGKGSVGHASILPHQGMRLSAAHEHSVPRRRAEDQHNEGCSAKTHPEP